MNRRGFVSGLLAMPAIIRTPGLLMPVKAEKKAAFIITGQLSGYTKPPIVTWMSNYQFGSSDYILPETLRLQAETDQIIKQVQSQGERLNARLNRLIARLR